MSRARAPFDRLSAADVSHFLFERPGQSYAVALVAVVDVTAAGPSAPETLRALLAERAASIPELNQRVHFTRWGEGRPLWLRQPADLEHHVRVLGPVDGQDELAALAARLVALRLPRDRPLWEIAVVPGAGPGRVGLVVRIHHAVADGLAAMALAAGLFDPVPGVEPASVVPPMVAESPPRSSALRRARLAELAAGRPRRARRAGRSPGERAQALAEGVRRVLTMTRRHVPDTCLLGPLGPERALHLLTVDLEPVRLAGHRRGGTVTDAVLAGVAAGLRALLAARGESVMDLPVSVPVSLRGVPGAEAGSASHGNRVGLMVVRLPVSERDPERRAALVRARTRTEKPRARAAGTFVLTRTRWSTRLMDAFSRHQHLVASFVTSVPGPTAPLRLGGADVVAAWPATVLAGNVRLALAVLSYAGRLHLSVISDPQALPDVAVFADALRLDLEAL
jgi:WS/DGAT/MGAT family acyltransferase